MTINKKTAEKLIAAALLLIVWELAADFLHQKILLVGPVQVFLRLFTIWQEEGFTQAIIYSITHICGGYLIGLLFGIFCAALAYRFSVAEILLAPWTAVFRTVPVASFVVICLIWMSSRNLPVFISFLIVFPIVYKNILTAFRGIDPNLIDLARMEQMSYPKMLATILIPQIGAQLISTASLTAGMAWKAGIAAEIIGTPAGSIGKQVYLAKIYLDTDDLLAWTVIVVLLSMVCEKFFVLLLRRLLPQAD